METTNSRHNLLTVFALLLTLPTFYFVSVGILSEFGINGPINAIQSTLEKWGSREGLGWNINLLILFGPVLAFLLAIFLVLKIEWKNTGEEFSLNFTIQKRLFPLTVVLISIGLLAILFIYAWGENCHCA